MKYLPIEEFRRLGYLQEVNRLFFHPLGLALEVRVGPDGKEFLGGVWDCREEGISFSDSPDREKSNFIRAEWYRRTEVREHTLGYVYQRCDPPEEEAKP